MNETFWPLFLLMPADIQYNPGTLQVNLPVDLLKSPPSFTPTAGNDMECVESFRTVTPVAKNAEKPGRQYSS